MKRLFVFALAVILMIAADNARAINCTWDAVPSNINFGTYFPLTSGRITANSGFQFTCTPPAVATLMLSRGAAPTYNRYMPRTAAPAANMDYNLYMDAATSIIWGDGTGGTQYLTFSSLPQNKTYAGTIFGAIPANLDVPPGTYLDTIQATLDWGTGIDQRFFTVTATVSSECSVSTATLNFGAYDPVSANLIAPLDSTSVINVYCTKNTLATVALDNGLWFSGGNRRIQSGLGDFLNYQLYTDAGHSIIWNAVNTDSGTSTSKLTPINGGFTAYGRIFPGQDVRAGSFTDTVLVTVNY